MAAKKKVIATVAAVATSAALLLGGTMAWQSANQVALNEASDVINPGGRLHDDFNGSDKNVYVENFAEDEIFARVRFDEYFEIIMNYDADNPDAPQTKKDVITTYVDDEGNEVEAVREYTSTYVTHKFGETNATDEFWNWTMGGQDPDAGDVYYMPTFNLNKDSLAADVNGVFNGANFDITDKDDGDQYTSYVDYSTVPEKTGYEIYDGDTNNVDELSRDHGVLKELTTAVNDIIDTGVITGYEDNLELTEEKVAHTAAQVNAETGFISMADWDGTPGAFWVYDTDGWCYWAQPIDAGETTGLLMDGIALDGVMDDTWYYAINVVAQFITADDMGKTNGTGFYDTTKGEEPSSDALTLLKAIGVEVPITTQAELQAAFEQGDTITLPDVEITSDEAKNVGLNVEFAYSWTEGGTLNGGTLNDTSDTYAGLFINNEMGWPESGDGASNATVNDTEISSNSDFAVYVQAIDAPATLNNMKVHGENGGVYAEHSNNGNTVTLNNLDVVAGSNHATDWVNTAVAAATGANVEINGGTYEGKYAAYVYSSGGSITINGGTFTGALRVDAGSIVIKGGTFDHDPSEFVADGYEAVDNGDGTWTVQADTSDKTAPTVSIIEEDYFHQIITISEVSDEDFPLTVEMYELPDEDANYTDADPAMTITITKSGDNIAYTTTEASTSNHNLIGVTMSNGIIAINYNLAPDEPCYLHAVVPNDSGNTASDSIKVSGATGCFAAGTKVLIEDGLKNIEDITLGELVWSVNMETYQPELKPVTYVQGERYTPATYTLYVADEVIVTTYEHPFYANGEWTAAEDLKAGDMLRRMDGSTVAIDKVVYTELAKPLRVYNFTVDENHCYIVSAQELLVHNIKK